MNDKAGPFHYVICVGSFFSIEDDESEDPNLVYIAKEFKDSVPMPIYVLGPCHESQRRYYKPLFKEDLRGTPTFEEGFDIACNVSYVGRKGVLSTVDELKIAYLSGLECKPDQARTDYTFNATDIEELTELCATSRIDVLMTTAFPNNVNEFSYGGKSDYYRGLCEKGSKLVSKLARCVLPRYHFVPSEEEFFEREPYRNHQTAQEQPKLVTRFLSVAAVAKPKQKWLYAFNIVPARWLTRDEVNAQPDDATENPYLKLSYETKPKISQPEINSNGQFFYQQAPQSSNGRYRNQSRNPMNPMNDRYDHRSQSRYPMNDSRNPSRSSMNDSYESSNSSNGPYKRSAPSGEAAEDDKRPKLGENSCWFCLSSAKVEKHLIISIGDRAYLGEWLVDLLVSLVIGPLPIELLLF